MNNKVNRKASNNSNKDSLSTFNNKSDNSKTSLSEISFQNLIRTISQNTLSSTHRMLDYCDQSELIGEKTGRKLVEQDEKLNNINNDLENIDDNLNQVEKNFQKLNSKGCKVFSNFFSEILHYCCCCFCPRGNKSLSLESLPNKKRKHCRISDFFLKIFRKKKNYHKSDLNISNNLKKLSSYEFTSDEDGSFLSNRFESKLKIKNLYDQASKKSSANVSFRQTSFDKSIMNLNGQLSENLKFLDKKLTSLQSMANDIGDEINKQNHKIETTNFKALETRNKVKNTNEIGKRILKTKKSLPKLNKSDKNSINVLLD